MHVPEPKFATPASVATASVATASVAPASVAPAPLSPARQLAEKARGLSDTIDSTADDFAAAESLVKRALELDQTDGEMWAVSSRINSGYLSRGFGHSSARLEAARGQAERAVKLAPDSAEAWHALGRGWLTIDFVRAEESRRHGLKLAPQNGRILISLGSLFRRQNRYDEALSFCEQAAALPETRALARFDQYLIHFFSRRFSEADRCMGASPPKQVLAPTGRNRFTSPRSATGVSPVRRMGDTLVAPAAWEPPHQNKFLHRREETAFQAHHRRQECRRSVGWATLLSPLLHGSPPTKTSFGTDGKKQLYFPTNDLQKLFLESLPTKASFGTDGKKQLSGPTNDLQRLFLESLPTKTSFGPDWKKQISFPPTTYISCFLRALRTQTRKFLVFPFLFDRGARSLDFIQMAIELGNLADRSKFICAYLIMDCHLTIENDGVFSIPEEYPGAFNHRKRQSL